MGWDDVDLLGFDGLGDPAGLGALYGAMIGAGVGSAAALGIRAYWPEATRKLNSELAGLLAGVAVGGAMMVSPKTRHAGLTAAAVAVITNGLRYAEHKFSGATTMGQVRASYMPRAAGLGMVQAEQLNGPRQSALPLLGLRGGGGGAPMANRYGHSYSAGAR